MGKQMEKTMEYVIETGCLPGQHHVISIGGAEVPYTIIGQ